MLGSKNLEIEALMRENVRKTASLKSENIRGLQRLIAENEHLRRQVKEKEVGVNDSKQVGHQGNANINIPESERVNAAIYATRAVVVKEMQRLEGLV